ncbi:hypothetical protein ATN01_00380 [Buchnera aphidicola (Diuraphis noxia)]|uniref:Flagellar FliJ protein n=1 Tax=Buchnera aphidicola subsp. Diuraphis noxia TaxID=118101 RepID=A0A1B2H979_BUCDN|nr:flagellar FliJ family protein [Buchnera aphidicola]ANZ22780.1 hypothetical protein ATN01_00380 [Buchnera aphidicola (Diuraphis noxia)]
MKSKKIIFSILEKIEKIKSEKELIKIKYTKEKNKQTIEQLQLLYNYEKEYTKTMYAKVKSGICVNEWKNYNVFISVLKKIINNNENIVQCNKKIIANSLKSWHLNTNRIKLWNNLNLKNKKIMLKIKKYQENKFNNDYIQLKSFKKG